MSFFCLFWTPLFYLFWRGVKGNNGSVKGGVWALLAGSLIAVLQFFLGYIVEPGGFGFSRWLSGFIDIVTLPALAPLIVYFILFCFKVVSNIDDFIYFSLLWLIPGAAMRALSWSSLNDPVLLVLVPVLWTSIVTGITFFIDLILRSRKLVLAPALLCIIIIPAAASFSYWAFFAQKTRLGFLFFSMAIAPMLVSMVLSYIKSDS